MSAPSFSLLAVADIEVSTQNTPAGEHVVALKRIGPALVALALLGTSHPALAHTGSNHALSFASGFAHPWTGLDHMLAFLAVGLWAGLNGARALWAWPAAFVGAMLAGGALGIAGLFVPMAELGPSIQWPA